MVLFTTALIVFAISLVISAIIIFAVTKMFGETEGFGTALFAAFIGALIYGVAYFLIGSGVWASVIDGIAWLIALGSLYNIGWLKSLVVAVFVWLIAGIVGYFLPTVMGPL